MHTLSPSISISRSIFIYLSPWILGRPYDLLWLTEWSRSDALGHLSLSLFLKVLSGSFLFLPLWSQSPYCREAQVSLWNDFKKKTTKQTQHMESPGGGETVFDDAAQAKLSAEYSHMSDFSYTTWSRISQLSPINPRNSEKSCCCFKPLSLGWSVMRQQSWNNILKKWEISTNIYVQVCSHK